MMASSSVDKLLKETNAQFLHQRQPPEWFEDNSGNEEKEPHLSPGPVDKEPTHAVKTPSANKNVLRTLNDILHLHSHIWRKERYPMQSECNRQDR